MVEEGKEGEWDDATSEISMSSTQIKENKKFINKLKRWASAKKKSSATATVKGIARLVEKIAHDGRVSVEDENLILETLVVMDTLIVALATAQLCFEDLPDNGHWSKRNAERILFAYHTVLATMLYFTVCHLVLVLVVSGLSTYIFEVKGIITFFVRCHTVLVHVNFSGLILTVPAFLVVPVLAQLYSYGWPHALPSVILCAGSFLVIGLSYSRVVKPVFIGLYVEEYDIGSAIGGDQTATEESDKDSDLETL